MKTFKEALLEALVNYELYKNPHLELLASSPLNDLSSNKTSSCASFTWFRAEAVNKIPCHRMQDLLALRNFIETTNEDSVLFDKIVSYLDSNSFKTGFKLLTFDFGKGNGYLPELINTVIKNDVYSKEQLILNDLFGGNIKVPAHLKRLKGYQLEKAKSEYLTHVIGQLKDDNRYIRNVNHELFETIQRFVEESNYADDDVMFLKNILTQLTATIGTGPNI